MDKIDIIIYANELIKNLEQDGFFDFEVFIEKDYLKEKIIEQSERNLINYGNYKLSVDELSESIKEARLPAITDALHNLIKKDVVDIVGCDENGEFLYSLKKK